MPEEFKILSPRDHVRARIGMYLGSASIEEVERFILGEWRSVRYVPAITKMIDEIIDNSIDEAIRTKFKYANNISVWVEDNTIVIEDNGRGIPQDEVLDVDGNQTLRPVAAWTKVNAGTSFSDERISIGANGVGSACTNFCSKTFIGETWRDGKLIKIDCRKGASDVMVINKKATGSGTRVTFQPDFSLFKIDNLSEVDTALLIQDRLQSLEIAFPEIAFRFNGRRTAAKNIRQYGNMFSDHGVYETCAETKFFFTPSPDGFRTTSYINGVNTRLGGTYVDWIINNVIDSLSTIVKKKHKIDITKSTFKSGLTFVLFARGFINPQYDSQTKERLTNNVSDVRNHLKNPDFEKIARKIFTTEEIINPIIEAQLAKKLAADKRAALAAQKKIKKVKVAKHVAATRSDARLLLTEGDSALGFCIKVRDPKKIGCLPLRGVVPNTWQMNPTGVLKNKELSEIIAVLGLDVGDPDSIDHMRYGEVGILTDADSDGAGHICPLLLAFFYKFWPRLFTEKKICIVRTPIQISTKGKDVQWFYDYESAGEFKANSNGYYHRYIKGLASHTEEEYSSIVNKPKLDYMEIDNPNLFEMLYGPESQLRKDWLS